ncbi:unnamed protein product, partial [Polarella glacialis]
AEQCLHNYKLKPFCEEHPKLLKFESNEGSGVIWLAATADNQSGSSKWRPVSDREATTWWPSGEAVEECKGLSPTLLTLLKAVLRAGTEGQVIDFNKLAAKGVVGALSPERRWRFRELLRHVREHSELLKCRFAEGRPSSDGELHLQASDLLL